MKTHVLAPSITTDVIVLKPDIATTELEHNEAITLADKHLSATVAMVIMVSMYLTSLPPSSSLSLFLPSLRMR
jgi:hypothetical protein